MQPDRYIMDVLYGQIDLPDYVWRVLPSPELQRLREVRLCNVNSLCLTGGANINRYEHALGTAYLARECLRTWPSRVPTETEQRIVLAALLHDIASGAFGHSVQYVIDSDGFEHERVDHMFARVAQTTGFAYQEASLEPVFFGVPKHLPTLLTPDAAEVVAGLIAGRGRYGQLISADMDFDNIDNVFRLAYHIGVSRDNKTPLELARSMWIESDDLTIRRDALHLVECWQTVRRRLYEFLLLNPDEFSAKCMLERALIEASESQSYLWHHVDFEVMSRLAQASSDTRFLASRLMVGSLYGCVGIYATADLACHERLAARDQRAQVESSLRAALRGTGIHLLRNAVVRIHTIKDVGKTDRRVTLRTDDGVGVSLGHNSRRVLIGVFLENRHLSMDELPANIVEDPRLQDAVLRELSRVTQPVNALRLYAERRAEAHDGAE